MLFRSAERKTELARIIADENLKPEAAQEFVQNAFRNGELRTTGTAITKILPPISRFAPSGGHELLRYAVTPVRKKILSGVGVAARQAPLERDARIRKVVHRPVGHRKDAADHDDARNAELPQSRKRRGVHALRFAEQDGAARTTDRKSVV